VTNDVRLTPGLRHYELLFGDQQRAAPTSRTLDRASLPTPLAYLEQRQLLKRRPRGEWVSIPCPAHKGGAESNPSLRVSLLDAHFRCMACGVRGGDIIALHRLLTGASFAQAVSELGVRCRD